MSETKYEPVRAKGFLGVKEPKDLYINTNSEVKMTTVSQLDRIEQKMDRILEQLECQELPTSVNVNGKAIAEIIKSDFEKNKLNRRHL
ncbi:hypothetical protein [Cytobacillus kochii]|uniref:hypothetical protein n=1 Tax=Cytobacillus kochii TaxID=859143 RepID=UPI00402AD5D4